LVFGIFCSFNGFSRLIQHFSICTAFFSLLLERFLGIRGSQNAIAAFREDTSSNASKPASDVILEP